MRPFSLLLCRKPDLVIDPENLKVREPLSAENVPAGLDDSNVDNRFSETASSNKSGQKKCGWQAFMQRIVGGEICEIDEFPWAALLLYESSGNQLPLSVAIWLILRNFLQRQRI